MSLGDEAAGSENVLGVEGGFEAEHEGEIGARRSPYVDGALESGWAPRKRGGGVLGSAERKKARNGFGEALKRSRVLGLREQSKVEDAARTGENGVRERSLVSEREQLLKEHGEAGGESRDFENGGGGRRFEKERN